MASKYEIESKQIYCNAAVIKISIEMHNIYVTCLLVRLRGKKNFTSRYMENYYSYQNFAAKLAV